MREIDYQVAVIGGGPAGLAAALAAREAGAERVCILERDVRLGGILNQCIHNGFGLHTFSQELTGPEYAARYVEDVYASGIDVYLDTMVVDIQADRTITAVSRSDGMIAIKAQSVVLAMGCRERSRGVLNIPGARPAGIYCAGTAQYIINIQGEMVGREAVILGSGDIGLIMARRMTYEGATVKAVCEVMPYSSGLSRNVVQCLNDLDIPLLLSHTAVHIHGNERVEGVTVAKVDENRRPIAGTEQTFACDTLLLSVGLIPENELSQNAGLTLTRATGGPAVDQGLMTDIPGIFACGNVLHVHDLVDYVSQEAHSAGQSAAQYARTGKTSEADIQVIPGDNVRYTVPQRVAGGNITFRFRVIKPLVKPRIVITQGDAVLYDKRKLVCTPGEMETVQCRVEEHGEDVHIHVREDTK